MRRARVGAARRGGTATSLGVIFYELLAGTRPFEAQTPQAIMRQHLNMRPPALRERAPWVSERLCQLVHGMLAKDGRKRPSMAQVQERLAVGGRSAALERLRHPAVIAVAFTLLSSGGWMLWRHHEHTRAGHPAVHAGPLPTAAPPPASVASAQEPTTAPAASTGAMLPQEPAASPAAAPQLAAATGLSGEPTPTSAAPAAAAGPPPTPAASGSSALPATSRSVRSRGQRASGRRVQPAAPTPAPKTKPAGGILKAIDFGKH